MSENINQMQKEDVVGQQATFPVIAGLQMPRTINTDIKGTTKEEIAENRLHRADNGVIDKCFHVLKAASESSQDTNEKSPYWELEKFRKFVLNTELCELIEIQEYIASFDSDDYNLTNQFMEILAEFLLPMAYAYHNRVADIIQNERIMCMLFRYIKYPLTRYNALLVISILCSEPNFKTVRLGPIVDLLTTKLSESCLRLVLTILANALLTGHALQPAQALKVQNAINRISSREPKIASARGIIASILASTHTSLSCYLECLHNEQAIIPAPPGFWKANISSVIADFPEILSLLMKCINFVNKKVATQAANDLLAILTLQPELSKMAAKAEYIDVLIGHLDDPEDEYRYAIIHVTNILVHDH